MLRSLICSRLAGCQKCIHWNQIRFLEKDYDKIKRLDPPVIEYKHNDDRFFPGPKPEDEPYVKLTDDEILDLSSVKLEKDYPERHWTQVDPNEEPYCQVSQHHDNNRFTQVEVIQDPKLWFWVQRLMPKPVPDEPKCKPGEVMPSGFSVPPTEKPNLPYFVARTRTKVLPVYRKYEVEGRSKDYWKNRWDSKFSKYHQEILKKLDEVPERTESILTTTWVRKIYGDIWILEEDLRGHLEQVYQRKILSAVNEVSGDLKLKGDYVMDVVKWLTKTGF